MRILIVDNSSTMRKVIRRNLRQAGYDVSDVLEAGDGTEGLAVLGDKAVDVILSEVNMPNMGGLEFLEKVKESEATSSIPVFMITTENTPDAITECTNRGAVGCMGKPFTAESLGAALASVLS